MDKLVALCKNRGFIFRGSEIYGGLANTWDYGPLGVELKNNVKKAWWKKFVQENEYNVGLDCAILMNPLVWEASGHVGGFSDPLMDCKDCKTRHRADQLIEDYLAKNGIELSIAGWNNDQMEKYIADKKIKCPVCGNSNFTGVRQFNLMFRTFQGVTEDSSKAFAQAVLDEMNELCGILGLKTERKAEVLDSEIEELIEKRQAARKEKNFALADEIRAQLLDMGIELKDTREGVKWKRS